MCWRNLIYRFSKITCYQVIRDPVSSLKVILPYGYSERNRDRDFPDQRSTHRHFPFLIARFLLSLCTSVDHSLTKHGNSLYGIICMQAFFYFRTCGDDSWRFKTTIVVLPTPPECILGDCSYRPLCCIYTVRRGPLLCSCIACRSILAGSWRPLMILPYLCGQWMTV